MAQKLSGKVVLVTGAASGIGQAAALRVAEEGAITIVGDLQETAGNQTVRVDARHAAERTRARSAAPYSDKLCDTHANELCAKLRVIDRRRRPC